MAVVELLNKRDLVDRYLAESTHHLSAYSFVNIFAWKDFFDFDIKAINQNLCIFAKNELGCFLYWMPLGVNVSEETIDACFAHMDTLNDGLGIGRIENVSQDHLSLFDSTRYDFYKKGCEYCYFKQDIVDLKGNRYKSKRSSDNHFRKNYIFEYCPFNVQMLDACMDLYDRWSQSRKEACLDDIYQHMLVENRNVHELALRSFESLGLVGRVVKVDGQIKAYTFGYEISKNIFCVFLEVADLECKGLSVYIFRKLCQDAALSQYQFINVMDDFEMNNVGQTKMSFHPTILFPSFVVKKKGSHD